MMTRRSQPILRLPREKIPALVALGSERFDVSLYLAPGQGVGGFFDGTDRFCPIDFHTGTRLVASSAIAWISVHVVYAVTEDELPGERQRVSIHLRDGGTVSGELRWVGPPDRRRTLDHLNDTPNHLELYDGNHVTFVPKVHVVTIEEL